jgi:hypothetical protein
MYERFPGAMVTIAIAVVAIGAANAGPATDRHRSNTS